LGDAGWAGDTMNYSVSSPTSMSVSLSNADSDMNSETEENDSEVKDLNTTLVPRIMSSVVCVAVLK